MKTFDGKFKNITVTMERLLSKRIRVFPQIYKSRKRQNYHYTIVPFFLPDWIQFRTKLIGDGLDLWDLITGVVNAYLEDDPAILSIVKKLRETYTKTHTIKRLAKYERKQDIAQQRYDELFNNLNREDIKEIYNILENSFPDRLKEEEGTEEILLDADNTL